MENAGLAPWSSLIQWSDSRAVLVHVAVWLECVVSEWQHCLDASNHAVWEIRIIGSASSWKLRSVLPNLEIVNIIRSELMRRDINSKVVKDTTTLEQEGDESTANESSALIRGALSVSPSWIFRDSHDLTESHLSLGGFFKDLLKVETFGSKSVIHSFVVGQFDTSSTLWVWNLVDDSKKSGEQLGADERSNAVFWGVDEGEQEVFGSVWEILIQISLVIIVKFLIDFLILVESSPGFGNIEIGSGLVIHLKNTQGFSQIINAGSLVEPARGQVLLDTRTVGLNHPKSSVIVPQEHTNVLADTTSSVDDNCISCIWNLKKLINFNFDQSIDEIKLLRYINVNGDVDQNHVLRLHDFFYHKEHLFIVTELLKDNLYDYYKFNREKEQEEYFTVGRLQKITLQLLQGLSYIHSLKLVHCDLKPENIMMKSYSRAEVKIIDFGSSCFVHDNLGSYVQSRAYRAPEVILGCKYDYKIDIWSLGCILSELFTGSVLFQSDSLQGLLARIVAILGPFPEWMLDEGKLTHKYFTKEKLLYQDVYADDAAPAGNRDDISETSNRAKKTDKVQILVPKKSGLSYRLRSTDLYFLDFVRSLLRVDPNKRPTAAEAMNHPWITTCTYSDGLRR